MKIYTKTGDKGSTSLIGGVRVSKADMRLNAYGTIDELNSFLGLLRAKTTEQKSKDIIFDIQNTLFVVGAYLALSDKNGEIPQYATLDVQKIEQLEQLIDFMDGKLPKINNFIIYGENETSGLCHVARAVARRAEREIVALNEQERISDNIMQYINRLSDFLFVFARYYSINDGKEDFFWSK